MLKPKCNSLIRAPQPQQDQINRTTTLGRSSRTSRARWRTCSRTRAAQSRPCTPWSKWCPSSSRESTMNSNLTTSQAPNSHHNNNRIRPVAVRHSSNRWWKIATPIRSVKTILGPRTPRPIMTHLQPLLAPCLTTFSVSRPQLRSKKIPLLALIIRPLPVLIYPQAWAKLTWTTWKNSSWACSKT